MSKAVHRSPNKLWRCNSVFNLWSLGTSLRHCPAIPAWLILYRRSALFQLIFTVHALSLAHPADKIFFNHKIYGETVKIIILVCIS